MSVQYKTVLCLQLKCIPGKERMHMDICSYFLFCVVINNFSRLLALKWKGKKVNDNRHGSGGAENMFFLKKLHTR